MRGDNHTKKDSTINTLPFFFWVRAGNSQFIEERGLFSHFRPLLSFSLRFCPLFFHEHVKWNRSFLYPYQVWQYWEQPEDLWNKFSFLNEFCPGLTTVSLEVTDQFLIYIIFFSLNKTNRRSNIPSQIGSFMINMSVGKENFMR